MRRNRKSLLNALAAVLLTVANGLFALVFTKSVITFLGSDFNGLNATANQLVTILNLFEGGFTIAINVALFQPYLNRETARVNAIVSATKKTFHRIGLLSAAAGAALALGYSFVVQSGYSQPLIFCVFLMTLLPVSFNFYYATKYRILLQAEQSEYVISLFTIMTNALGYGVNILLLYLGSGVWPVRFVTMCFSICNSVLIGIYVKKHFPHISDRAEPDFQALKGTRDVLIQKLTGVVYSTAPMLCITLTSGGTAAASVYAVYNNVFVLLKGVMHAVIDAPRLGLGELAAEGDERRLWDVFLQYELIVKMMLMCFLTTAAVLIMPFIRVYTRGVSDVEYDRPMIAVLLLLICFFEHLHMPSGHLINMTGQFKISKNIQLIAMAVLVVGCMISLITEIGLIGILWSVLCTAVSLCMMEIGTVYMRFFKGKIFVFLKHSVFVFLCSLLVIAVEQKLSLPVHGYISLAVCAAVIFLVNAALTGICAYVMDRQNASRIFARMKRMLPVKLP